MCYFVLSMTFCKAFVQWWQKMLLQGDGERKKRNRSTRLHLSEIITIMLAYHESGYGCFKDYYRLVMFHHRKEFPHLVSYDRFVALMKRTFGIVMMLFAALRDWLLCPKIPSAGFMDSNSLFSSTIRERS